MLPTLQVNLGGAQCRDDVESIFFILQTSVIQSWGMLRTYGRACMAPPGHACAFARHA